MFAEKVIKKGISSKKVKAILNQEFLNEDILGVVQHHDAISGTAKQYVTFDYEWHLAN